MVLGSSREVGEPPAWSVDQETAAFPVGPALTLARPITARVANPPQPPLIVLILARNESTVLGETLRHLAGCLGPEDRLHVVADQCSDGTVELARRSGAEVHVRAAGEGRPGKGGALRWWVDRMRGGAAGRAPVVVLDADSLPSPGLLDGLRQAMASGASAAQAEIRPVVLVPSGVGLLAAYSEITEQRVFDDWRARLGWPVRLRGTGMAIRRDVLERAASRLSTRAEDIELTVLIASSGESICPVRSAGVYDPKPADAPGASRQRARWLQGQAGVLRRHPREVLRLILRGPAGWSLLESLFLRPKTFILPLKAVSAAASWTAAVHSGNGILGGIAFAASLWLAVDGIGLVAGLRLMPDAGTARRTLLASPLYLTMWLRSVLLSAVSRDPWLRSRLPLSRASASRGGDEL